MQGPVLCAFYPDMNLSLRFRIWLKLLRLRMREPLLRNYTVGDMLAMCIFVIPMMLQFVFLLVIHFLQNFHTLSTSIRTQQMHMVWFCTPLEKPCRKSTTWNFFTRLATRRLLFLVLTLTPLVWALWPFKSRSDIYKSAHANPDLLQNGLHPDSLAWHAQRSSTLSVLIKAILIASCGLESLFTSLPGSLTLLVICALPLRGLMFRKPLCHFSKLYSLLAGMIALSSM